MLLCRRVVENGEFSSVGYKPVDSYFWALYLFWFCYQFAERISSFSPSSSSSFSSSSSSSSSPSSSSSSVWVQVDENAHLLRRALRIWVAAIAVLPRTTFIYPDHTLDPFMHPHTVIYPSFQPIHWYITIDL
jgi:hypothetical protein